MNAGGVNSGSLSSHDMLKIYRLIKKYGSTSGGSQQTDLTQVNADILELRQQYQGHDDQITDLVLGLTDTITQTNNTFSSLISDVNNLNDITEINQPRLDTAVTDIEDLKATDLDHDGSIADLYQRLDNAIIQIGNALNPIEIDVNGLNQLANLNQPKIDNAVVDIADLKTRVTALEGVSIDQNAISDLTFMNNLQNTRLNNAENAILALQSGGGSITQSVLTDIIHGQYLLQRYTGTVFDVIARMSSGGIHASTTLYGVGQYQQFNNLAFFDNDPLYPSIIDNSCSDITREQVSFFVNASDNNKNIFIDTTPIIQALDNARVFRALDRLNEYNAGTATPQTEFKYRLKIRGFYQWNPSVANSQFGPQITYSAARAQTAAETGANNVVYRITSKHSGSVQDIRTDTVCYDTLWYPLSNGLWVSTTFTVVNSNVSVTHATHIQVSVEVQPYTYHLI